MKTRRRSLSVMELFILVTGAGVFLVICKWYGLEHRLAAFTTCLFVFALVAIFLGARQ